MNTTRLAAAAFAALAIGAGAYGLADRREAAPAVTYTLLDGSRAGIEQLRGKVVLVNFWATSCTTCVLEMPQFVATHEKYRGRGLETVAVAMPFDPPAYVINFAQSRQLPFGVAIDGTGDIARRFGDVRLTPTVVLIDKRGQIVKRYVGEPDFAKLHRQLEKLLAET